MLRILFYFVIAVALTIIAQIYFHPIWLLPSLIYGWYISRYHVKPELIEKVVNFLLGRR